MHWEIRRVDRVGLERIGVMKLSSMGVAYSDDCAFRVGKLLIGNVGHNKKVLYIGFSLRQRLSFPYLALRQQLPPASWCILHASS